MERKLRIALLGGGPSALFMFKRLVESGRRDIVVSIFEKKSELGSGMPYGRDGANDEHITNVSGNEIPEIVTPVIDWIRTLSKARLNHFNIDPEKFSDYRVLPRLLFGDYLSNQFNLLLKKAQSTGLEHHVCYESKVEDIIDNPKRNDTTVVVNDRHYNFDRVVICTGHYWPKIYEGKISGYFDSPYPPQKLSLKLNHPVALKGASLTAIDAIRTLAKANGVFEKDAQGQLKYHLAEGSEGFRIVMHSRNGLLPAVRFHLADSHLAGAEALTRQEMTDYRVAHDGFLSLDYIFEKNFKELFRDKDPEFYVRIKDLNMEQFVGMMMEMREHIEPFHLFRAEYIEAEKSIKRHQSIYWKEMLAILSFSLNYPAKYLPAEDFQRLKKTLMPLIAIVIAFVPQGSCEHLLALHNAGLLDMIPVGEDSYTEPNPDGGATYHYVDEKGTWQSSHFKTYIDCTGQKHLAYDELPFKGLKDNSVVSQARLMFKDPVIGRQQLDAGNDVTVDSNGNYYLKVPGIAINDNFQVLDNYGAFNPRMYMMAVPYMGGFNPDYSGLDFCASASAAIMTTILTDYD